MRFEKISPGRIDYDTAMKAAKIYRETGSAKEAAYQLGLKYERVIRLLNGKTYPQYKIATSCDRSVRIKVVDEKNHKIWDSIKDFSLEKGFSESYSSRHLRLKNWDKLGGKYHLIPHNREVGELSNDSRRCPVCQSEKELHVRYKVLSKSIQEDSVIVKKKCLQCNGEWLSVYKLSQVILNIQTK